MTKMICKNCRSMSADVGSFISEQRQQLMQERRDLEGNFASDGFRIDNQSFYSQVSNVEIVC